MRELSKIRGLQNVSRETVARLDAYAALLLKWNRSINLVSKNHASSEDIWQRHIIDSLQLLPHIPSGTQTITDFGSGAGFPGLMLAYAGDWHVHLVESDQRKSAFLREAARLGAGNVTVHTERAESVTPWPSEVLTARALAPLDALLSLTEKFHAQCKLSLFLKGQNVVEEIDKASISWDFNVQQTPSVTDKTGVILVLSGIKKK